MQPQGTALVNAAYFDALTADINAINACSELQKLVDAAMATLQAEVTAIEMQIAALLPLISIPTDLGSAIRWITAFINRLTGPYLNYILQLAQTLAAIARLVQAIEAAAERLTHCSIAIPSITVAPGVGTPTTTVHA